MAARAGDGKGCRRDPFRVLRGGCWFDDSQVCRSANRRASVPEYRGYDVGFRVAAVPAR